MNVSANASPTTASMTNDINDQKAIALKNQLSKVTGKNKDRLNGKAKHL